MTHRTTRTSSSPGVAPFQSGPAGDSTLPNQARAAAESRELRVSGVYAALLTPFDGEGRIDVAALARLVDDLVDIGVDGLVALGTTGEFSDLTEEERTTVAAAAVRAASGRVPVVVGVGALGTAESCARAARAEQAGADGVLALPPMFWKLDEAALFNHFASVARATSLPVLLYDIPIFAGMQLSSSLVVRIAKDLPSVVGIKMTVTDLRSVLDVLAAVKPVRPDFSVTVGFEDLALSAMLAGADGVISGMANFCAPHLISLVADVRRGDVEAAGRAHARVMRLFPVYFQSSPPVVAMKVLARALGVQIEPRVRSPYDASPADLARISAWVDAVARRADPD